MFEWYWDWSVPIFHQSAPDFLQQSSWRSGTDQSVQLYRTIQTSSNSWTSAYIFFSNLELFIYYYFIFYYFIFYFLFIIYYSLFIISITTVMSLKEWVCCRHPHSFAPSSLWASSLWSCQMRKKTKAQHKERLLLTYRTPCLMRTLICDMRTLVRHVIIVCVIIVKLSNAHHTPTNPHTTHTYHAHTRAHTHTQHT